MSSGIRSWSLTRQLSAGTFILISIIMAVFLLVLGKQTSTIMNETVHDGQRNQTHALAAQLNGTYANILKNTERLASTFQQLYPDNLDINRNQTLKVGRYDAPVITHNGELVNLNFDQVDKFARMTGGNATVFIRYRDDFLRVTTSLKNAQGERAIGTLLGKKHPGYQQLMAGKAYMGEAHLFGTDYMTKYTPVIGRNGQVQAILYVGLPISDVMQALRENLNALTLGETGYVGLAYRKAGANQGKLLAHQTAQDKTLKQEYGALLGGQLSRLVEQSSGEMAFDINGRHAFMAFASTGGGDWTIFSVSYQDEFAGPLNTLLAEIAAGALFAALGLVLILSAYLNLTLKPVKRMRDLMHRIGKGDLTLRFQLQGGDSSRNELDQLKRSSNEMLEQFSSIIARVRNTGDELAATSQQVASTSSVMQDVVYTSRDETSQVSVAIDQMALSVESVAANAVAVFEDTGVTAELSANGSAVMNNIQSVIGELQQEFNQASSRIDQLEKDSEEIGKVVDVISAVAEQTNLLALNAAIEAARAGDQGRGFAVVADEVRTLSLRTQQATQEIQEVVSKLQANSRIATEQMQQGVQQVMHCVGQVSEAGQVLSQIREAADLARTRMHNVAQETEEQSAAALQIRDNGVSLKTSAEQMSGQAEENASAGRMIAEHANLLRQQVAHFSV